MFNLLDFKRRNEKNVLQYFETADSRQSFSYADLYTRAFEFSSNLQKILIENASNSKQSALNCNIAILLTVHSPALLPAIVGYVNNISITDGNYLKIPFDEF